MEIVGFVIEIDDEDFSYQYNHGDIIESFNDDVLGLVEIRLIDPKKIKNPSLRDKLKTVSPSFDEILLPFTPERKLVHGLRTENGKTKKILITSKRELHKEFANFLKSLHDRLKVSN
ncbi:hypothetical protein [Leptospira mtsangambouensis]|uniref:hypothetical protein n=1 Tax=Leptospira mtsangambouensis TaxID=2484912 RepID=UPI001EEC6C7C|nr:hypothetical protein [Leptospira mtsangambouensis]MCG6140630.1 hypothetical protein [Leptospira mtsangambouensis]